MDTERSEIGVWGMAAAQLLNKLAVWTVSSTKGPATTLLDALARKKWQYLRAWRAKSQEMLITRRASCILQSWSPRPMHMDLGF